MLNKILTDNDLCVNDKVPPFSLEAVPSNSSNISYKDFIASHVLNEKTDQERFLPVPPIATKNTDIQGRNTFPGAVPRERTVPGFVSGQGAGGDQSGLFPDIEVPFEHVSDPRDLVGDEEVSPYLDKYMPENEGFVHGNGSTDVFELLGRSEYCGETLVKLWNEQFNRYGYLPIDCKKWWCPVCGGKKGKIHKKRILGILEKVNFEKTFFRQFVFTLPESVRDQFKTRDGLNSLIKMCVKIVKKYFPRKKFIMYLHINGDQDPRKFHPHVNVHVFENLDRGVWKISLEMLDDIKTKYLIDVREFLKDYTLEKVDVHYEYRVGKVKMAHSIRYMSRPYAAAIVESKDEVFKELVVVGLQSFKPIRYYGFKKGVDYLNDDQIKIPKGYEFVCLVSRWQLNAECDSENMILVDGDDGLLYMIDRYKGS